MENFSRERMHGRVGKNSMECSCQSSPLLSALTSFWSPTECLAEYSVGWSCSTSLPKGRSVTVQAWLDQKARA